MRADRLAGACFLVLGVAALVFGLRIEELGLGQNKDPGPRVFPMVLGAILALGGLMELGVSLVKVGNHGSPSPDAGDRVEVRFNLSDFKNFWVVLLGLVLYAILIGVLGFSLSTLLFGVTMMVRLGVRWWVSVLVSLGLVVGIHLLFGQLFKVQLPAGSLGLPF